MFEKFYCVEIKKIDNSCYSSFFDSRKKAESLYSFYELYKDGQEFKLIEYGAPIIQKSFKANKQYVSHLDFLTIKYAPNVLKTHNIKE